MENASKALIMAGSILISIMIIGLVVFSYNQIVSVQRIKDNADSVSKLTEYSKMFEQYNTSIYGSELLSLANLREYYNYSQKDVEGYDKIEITVKIINQIKYDDNRKPKLYLKSGECSLENVRKALTDLEYDIANYEDANKKGYENEIEKGQKSVKYYAQLSNRQIAVLFKVPFTSGEKDYDIGFRLSDKTKSPKTEKLMNDIEKYKNLKTMYTGFKNTVFTCEKTGYNKYNGRINEMYFTEK